MGSGKGGVAVVRAGGDKCVDEHLGCLPNKSNIVEGESAGVSYRSNVC